MTVLELSNVSKRYGDLTALEPMDLALAAARTYVLLGPSGCGKSTVLKLALGLLKTDTGCVRIHGEELNVDNVLRLRQRVGYVIQDGGLFPHMTAADNVSLVAQHLGWKRERIDRLSATHRRSADGRDLGHRGGVDADLGTELRSAGGQQIRKRRQHLGRQDSLEAEEQALRRVNSGFRKTHLRQLFLCRSKTAPLWRSSSAQVG